MCEFRRCLWNVRNLLVLVLLVMTNMVFCIVQCNDTQAITKQGEELESYLLEYPIYVEQTLENAERMKTLSMLGNKESYGYRNLEKTAEDFERMRQVQVETGENRGVVLFGHLELTNLLLLGYGIYLVLLFTGEYRKGLSLLVYSTKKGRAVLGFWRICILCLGLFAGAVFLYGSNVMVLSLNYPGAEYGRSLQSVPEFMKCTWELTIRQYFICFTLFKYLAVVAIALGLLAAISLIRSMAAVVLAGLVLLGEALAYQVILPTATTNALKYVNLYGTLQGEEGFSYYLNLNLFGTPANVLEVQGYFLLCMILCFGVLTLYGQAKKAPEGIQWLRQLWDRITRFMQLHKPAFPVFFWEAYKIMVSQWGFLIVAVILYLAISSSTQTKYADFSSLAERYYYEQYGGELSAEKLKAAQKEEQKMTRYLNNSQRNLEKLEAGGATEQGNQAVAAAQRRIRELELKLPGLRAVIANMESGQRFVQETGVAISVIEPFSYNMLLKKDVKTYQRNLLYCLLCIILVFSGAVTYEKAAGTGILLHSLPYGRRRVMGNKVLCVVLLSIAISLPIHLIQFVLIHQTLPFENTHEMVQSLELLRNFPLYISIRWYLAGLYLYRCLIAAGVGCLVLWLGRHCKSRIHCVVISMVPLLVWVIWQVLVLH